MGLAKNYAELKQYQPGVKNIHPSFYQRPLFWIGVILVMGFGSSVTVLSAIRQSLPDVKEALTFARDGTLTIKGSDGTVLQKIGPATRDKVSFNNIPQSLIHAFLAAEDRRFYQHSGVDWFSIFRALTANLQSGEVVEGASTITQQLSRIVFLDQDQTLGRKLREALLAQKMESELTKNQVLERYLNLVYLGAGAYGVADAAWIYFGKTVDQLTLPEVATIAGLPPAPSLYSPLVDREAALKRRNIVLKRMQDAGYISSADAQGAIATQLILSPKSPRYFNSAAPYFTTYIQKELPKYVSRDLIEAGGLTVETTLNPTWQEFADKAVQDVVTIDGVGSRFNQAALISIDPRYGEIKAMVGGTDFNTTQFDRVTQALRQPGSTFKVFVYATAIAAGFSPDRTYLDAPFYIDGYSPRNYGGGYRGMMTMTQALTSSVNVVSLKTMLDVGIEPVINMAHNMGIKSELLSTYSLALGTSEVNMLEITSAYGTLAARGRHLEPHGIIKILNRRGEVIFESTPKSKQAVDSDTAALMTWMLENVVNSGTGAAAALPDRPVAGKTGTTEDARDLWFIGYIPQLVTSIWLGNDNSTKTWGTSGIAAYYWNQYMRQVIKDLPPDQFPSVPKFNGRKPTVQIHAVRGNKYDSPYPTILSPSTQPTPQMSGDPQNEDLTGTVDNGTQPLSSDPIPPLEPIPISPSENSETTTPLEGIPQSKPVIPVPTPATPSSQ